MTSTPPDPAAFFRSLLGEWEKVTNGVGAELLKTPEVARAMGGAQTAAANWQDMMGPVMARALAAANMPSRVELEDLSARLARIEAALFRIGARLDEIAPPAAAPAPPGPTRTRQPPAPDAGE
jgi:hypothetical protein